MDMRHQDPCFKLFSLRVTANAYTLIVCIGSQRLAS